MTCSRSSLLLKRYFTTKCKSKQKICIVGAGPAGFYAAQHLIKKLDNTEIDIIEKLPVPFGLVRFGVAPDHPDVKNVINTFTKVAETPGVNFLGNIQLGRDVTLKELRNAYNIVLLTYGADQSRNLGIPGENLPNTIEARKIVGWYNGTPWDKNLKIDLSGEIATIFGQGNVAIDVARILLTPLDELKKTDITQYALEALSDSKIKTVYLIGRRGPLQAAYTIKELREMLKLKNTTTIWKPTDFNGVAEHVPNLSRPKKRIAELMLKSVTETDQKTGGGNKEFRPIFFRSPLEIYGTNKVDKVLLGINKLEGEDILHQKSVLTDLREELSTNLVVTSIGYKSFQADPDILFDSIKGIVKNNHSRVEKGLYVSGWLGTGPTGVILTTMNNAFNVAEIIIKDIHSENLIDNNLKGGFEEINNIIINKNIQVVNWKDWKKIDTYEKNEGAKLGKPREKIVDLKEMLRVAAS